MSHLQRLLPLWSEGRAAYGSLRRIVRRTSAITTSANSIRDLTERCRKAMFHGRLRRGDGRLRARRGEEPS